MDWIDLLKKRWNLFAQGAAWIASVLGGFLLAPPPQGPPAEGNVVGTFGMVVIVLVLGLSFVPAQKWDRRRHTWVWWIAAIVLFACSIAAFFTYRSALHDRTVVYDDTRVVIGSRSAGGVYKPRVLALPSMPSPEDMVRMVQGRTDQIWSDTALDQSRDILEKIYVATLILFTLCVIAAIQASYCAQKPPG